MHCCNKAVTKLSHGTNNAVNYISQNPTNLPRNKLKLRAIKSFVTGINQFI